VIIEEQVCALLIFDNKVFTEREGEERGERE
jgi:hypothetical protein